MVAAPRAVVNGCSKRAAAPLPEESLATELKKLTNRLQELFQLDAEDLDFGMYRVLRLQRAAFHTFIDKTLVETVAGAFGGASKDSRAEIETKLQAIVAMATQVGGDPQKHPEYAELAARLTDRVDSSALERQVYGRLDDFFSRYYDEGDFISMPRWRGNTYAIPYNGEEVVLHWANKDQYYVKSGEYFARYSFEVKDGLAGKPLGLVTFRLANAESDPDNQKTAAEKGRRFRLVSADPVAFEGAELLCRFEYVSSGSDAAKQEAINEESVAAILSALEKLGTPQGQMWAQSLASKYREVGKAAHSLLSWHLRQYTEKNKRDYFIHKDLGGFLGRELDHYLKTEVFDLDAVDRMSDADVLRQRSLVKTIRAVARPVIDFLAVTENFQKQLFLKKKMVLRTDWCISLDRVPEEFYAEIAENVGQVQRWKDLFHIQEIEVPAMIPGGDGKGATVGVEFLKRNLGLVVETRLWDGVDRTFTPRLLAALGKGIDELVTGVMVKGENFQGLRLLTERYRERIGCIYIDPPYNAPASEVLYKNSFKHSAWLSLLQDRLAHSRQLCVPDAVHAVAIDENEHDRLGLLMLELFPDRTMTSVAVVHNPRGIQGAGFSMCHENVLFAVPSGLSLPLRRLAESKEKPLMKTGTVSSRAEGRTMFYPLYFSEGKLIRVGAVPEDSFHPGMTQRHLDGGEIEVWPIDSEGGERKWRYKASSLLDVADDVTARPGRDGRLAVYLQKDVESFRSVWTDAIYNAAEYGSVTIKNMVSGEFAYPKSVHAVSDAVRIGAGSVDGSTTLDFFAGSGTTGHAVLNLNREDEGKRKFILIEVNDYYDTVLVPRILKASYSKDWKEGKPVKRDPVPGGVFYKCLTLESYDDALANVVLPADNPLFHQPGIQYGDAIRYLLDANTNRAALDLHAFGKPFGWTTEVRRGGLIDPKHPVDLIETFNYLLGITVSRYQYFGSPNELRYIEGTVQEHGQQRRVLILWRDVDAVSDAKILALFDDKQFAPVSHREYDRIYINGDPTLANLRRDDEHWKVLAIEDEFKRLSFANDGDS